MVFAPDHKPPDAMTKPRPSAFSGELIDRYVATAPSAADTMPPWQAAHRALMDLPLSSPQATRHAAHAVATHVAAMECLRLARQRNHAATRAFERNRQAASLMRAFAAALRVAPPLREDQAAKDAPRRSRPNRATSRV